MVRRREDVPESAGLAGGTVPRLARSEPTGNRERAASEVNAAARRGSVKPGFGVRLSAD